MAEKAKKQAPKKDEPKVNPRRAARHAAQVACYKRNIELRKQGLPTPWMEAQANRAERRLGMKPQERTPLGNILVMMPDGHKRVKPGSRREVEAAIESRQRARAEKTKAATRQKKSKKVKAS